ncbi:hypothetical protein [Saccharopolyspora karakumensis]|nr:hypothetical protein [Saccharopolyspora karakumensis]
MTTGMEGLAAGASALEGQSVGLRAAVDNGQLVMNHESAEAVAKVYDDKADDLRQQRSRAERLFLSGSFGDCFIGHQLEKKFADKLRAPDTGLQAILFKMEQTLRDMAQAYRDSSREMQNTDEEHSRRVGRV